MTSSSLWTLTRHSLLAALVVRADLSRARERSLRLTCDSLSESNSLACDSLTERCSLARKSLRRTNSLRISAFSPAGEKVPRSGG